MRLRHGWGGSPGVRTRWDEDERSVETPPAPSPKVFDLTPSACAVAGISAEQVDGWLTPGVNVGRGWSMALHSFRLSDVDLSDPWEATVQLRYRKVVFGGPVLQQLWKRVERTGRPGRPRVQYDWRDVPVEAVG